jgi:hypothetical protein
LVLPVLLHPETAQELALLDVRPTTDLGLLRATSVHTKTSVGLDPTQPETVGSLPLNIKAAIGAIAPQANEVLHHPPTIAEHHLADQAPIYEDLQALAFALALVRVRFPIPVPSHLLEVFPSILARHRLPLECEIPLLASTTQPAPLLLPP